MTTRSLQKGSAEFLVLAVLDGPQRHGYEIAQLIDDRSEGRLKFQAARSIRCSTSWKSAAGSRAAGSRRPGSGAGASTG